MNKYNLDFNEAMNFANEYFDVIEDNLNCIKEQLKDNPEHLEVILNEMKMDSETVMELDRRSYEYLAHEEYQLFLNQILLNDMYMIFVDNILPGDDLTELESYLEDLREEQVIQEITDTIDNFIK